MANFWYIGSTKYTSVTAWAALTAKVVGNLVRQSAAPTVGNERVFVCIVAGTTLAAEPSPWTLTKGSKTAETAGPTWMECTGLAGINGDITNTQAWLAVKNTTPTLGTLIYDSVTLSLQICTTSGLTGNGSAPSFSATAGVTTADNSATWTSLGLASGFAAFAGPHSRLANAFVATWGAAGDTFYVSNNHAETQASAITLTGPGTAASPCSIICVTDTAAPPTAQNTTATISTTGANSILFSGYYYFYGVIFQAGSAANTASIISIVSTSHVGYFESCTFTLNNTSNSSVIKFGVQTSNLDSYNRLKNCTFIFGNSPQSIQTQLSTLEIEGGTIAGTGTIPATVFGPGNFANMKVRGVDLSTVNTNLFNIAVTTNCTVEMQNCKLNASAAKVSGTVVSQGGCKAFIHNSDSSGTNYMKYEQDYQGSIQSETTVVRTGGQSDGTTSLSYKIVTSANAKFIMPYRCLELTAWVDTTGSSHTATVYVTSNNTLTNGDMWVEVEYPTNSGNPQSAFADSRKTNVLAAASNLTSDGSTWGGSTTTQQSIAVSFTNNLKGYVKVRIYVAKASQTVYIDGKVVIT